MERTMITPALEREQTDESLRTERAKTDHHLEQKRAAIEEQSDSVLALARDRADDLLEQTRVQTDAARGSPTASVKTERTVADQLLDSERTVDAAQLTAEREERQRALAALIGMEREGTDRDLLSERTGADTALLTRDQFLGMVSHDLRTLLGGIALSTSLLLKDTPHDERGKKVIRRAEVIQRASSRMNRLLGDLLDVVSIEAGELRVTLAPNDVSAVLRDAVEAAQLAASAEGVRLRSAGPARPLEWSFDHDRILQVIGNLVGNAIKFTREGGEVTLAAEEVGDRLRFSVTDTGSGIPEEQLGAVFERFRQVSRFDRRGHGLGLHIAQSIIEVHGGRIWAESTLGEGSTFFFTLPRPEAHALRPGAKIAPTPAG